MKITVRVLVTILVTFVLTSTSYGQQEADSVSSPFLKGKWLTGLAGSISSSSSKLDTISATRAFTNQYAFNFSTGKFFKDRWLLGIALRMQRDNSRQFVDLESESLLFAPLISRYISGSSQGSIFIMVAPGYARFREKTVVVLNGSTTQEILKGDGLGLLTQLGYSFVLGELVVFDLGLGVNASWIKADRESQPDLIEKLKINRGDLIFSFGFNVILDEFFF